MSEKTKNNGRPEGCIYEQFGYKQDIQKFASLISVYRCGQNLKTGGKINEYEKTI